MAAVPSAAAAQDELNQLERVFLRLGHAETDEQLQSIISKFLPPVLLKLSSAQEGVRKKVMELLVHLNKRIKSRPKIQLPVETLLVQYQDPAAVSFVTNFTIIYIKMGYPRLPLDKQCELAPSLLTAMEGRPQPQQDSLMHLLIPTLYHMKYSTDAPKTTSPFNLAEKPKTVQLLLDFMLDVPSDALWSRQSAQSGQGSSTPGSTSGVGIPQPPPGMSFYSAKRVVGDIPWTAEQLEQCKLGIVKFIEAEQVPELEAVIHLVIASSDTRHGVATAADLELRSKQSLIDWNDPIIINKMYKVYLGDIPLKTKEGNILKPELKRDPVSTRVKLKIVPHLLRSRLAAELFPSNIQMVYDGLFGGNTNAKLRILSLQFVHHICTSCPDSKIKPLGPMLLNGLTKLINEYKEDPKLLSMAYSAVGKLSGRMPQLFTKDLALVQQFFEAMRKEDTDVRLSIQEALSMMVSAYTNLEGAQLTLMEALVGSYLVKPEVQVREVAVKFASNVFAPDHIPSRYLLLLSAGDPREEVHGEAQRALRSFSTSSEKGGSRQKLPSFPVMVRHIMEKAYHRMKAPGNFVSATPALPFNPAAFLEIILYLRMCLAHSAGVTPITQSIADMQDQAPALGRYIRELVSSSFTSPESSSMKNGETNPVEMYISLLHQLLSAAAGLPVMYCLLEVVSVYPQKLAAKLVDKTDWIKSLMITNKEEMRELAAQLYAVVVSTVPVAELKSKLQNLIKMAKDNSNPEAQHGSLLALGYLIGRYQARQRNRDIELVDLEQPDTTPMIGQEEIIKTCTETIGLFLDNASPMLAIAATTALGEIGRNGSLPIPDEGSGLTKKHLVENLLARIPSGKETNKAKERAIRTLGYFPVGDGHFPYQTMLLQGLMESVEAKQVELQFTVGEAITNAAVGTQSSAARDIWIVTEDNFRPRDEVNVNDAVPWVLEQILNKHIVSVNPHVRQAACIWLLSLVKKLSMHQEIKSKLKEIQSAFISTLSENDELSQDVASKGLGLVYELGSEQDQQELVSTLVDTLMTGKRAKHEVSGDTEVFQGTSLGKTPDGQSLSTYKELCALASDLSQPDLIYKFMNLANHHAMWTSRKGAAFGFNVIADKAGEQLAPFLPQLVPRLYRYQFDPNTGIRQAMTSIWNALVTDKNTVDKYLNEILQDLINNLTSNMWRIRESSCLALNDLLRGRQLDDVVDKLPEIWETLFRVQDDIKESVRKAAELALKTLSKVCIRMCEPCKGAAGQHTIAVLLPCLLDKGMMSTVTEVRALSINTLVKISKSAGELLKPHTPKLIPALLESLSVLEPQVLNYLSLRATDQEKAAMDSARLSAAKSSPMMETINMCIQHLDVQVLGELVPRLCELIRSGLGLGTKGGCASVIVSLTTQCPQDLMPYSGKLMSALLNGLSDRNSVVQKSYAFALGHLVRTAKDSSTEKLLQKLGTWYMEKEEPAYRLGCTLTVHAMSRYSPDVLKNHAEVVLPLAFLAMHEVSDEEKSEKEDSNLWKEVWQENVPGSVSGGIRLYMKELIDITQKALQSPSWKMKAQGAAAMASIAKQQTGSLVPPHLGMIVNALLQGLPGRTWAGKEELLKALGTVVSACSEALKKPHPNQPSVDDIVQSVLKECRKENIKYKINALKCAADVLESTKEDRFQDLAEILFPLIKKTSLETVGARSPKDDDEDERARSKELQTESLLCAFSTLGKAWPRNAETQRCYRFEVCKLMCERLKLSTWKVQLGVLQSMNTYFQGLLLLEKEHSDNIALTEILTETCPAIAHSLENKSYSSVRTEALSVLELLLKKLEDSEQMKCLTLGSRNALLASLSTMELDSRPELREKGVLLKKKLENFN